MSNWPPKEALCEFLIEMGMEDVARLILGR